jgi:hypothetical protein
MSKKIIIYICLGALFIGLIGYLYYTNDAFYQCCIKKDKPKFCKTVEVPADICGDNNSVQTNSL